MLSYMLIGLIITYDYNLTLWADFIINFQAF